MKKFNIQNNIGKSKYVVSFHNGISTHADGSEFFDIRIFSNKKELHAFTQELVNNGYVCL